MNYNAIIIGGSFAGLSTAYFIKGDEILILEKDRELGLKQRSACGTLVDVLTKLNCEKSILKTFDTITFHSSLGSKAEVELPTPICTIDYRVFCTSMADGLKNVEVVTASEVLKINGGSQKEVSCKGKTYKSKVVVDCSGGKGVTANCSKNHGDVSKMARGIESEVAYEGDTDTVHIYFGNEFIKGGYGWVFPVGETRARVGIGSYHKSDILKHLHKFMKFLNVSENGLNVHGGLIPCSGLREPILDGVFLVGDACSQVLPVSGEGIRTSKYYGEICGSLISKVLNDELGLSEALDIYKGEVYKSKKFYDSLHFIQNIAVHASDRAWDNVVKKLNDGRLAQKLLRMYLGDEHTLSGADMLKKFQRVLT